jgi:type VI secretion system lysozyme-like protein
MVSVSLLQRLEEESEDGRQVADAHSEPAVIDSILTNLRLVLNSAEGCCETRVDYGLPDFGALGLSHSESAAQLAREIEKKIRLFEPRLRKTVVRPIDEDTKPTEFLFHVEAELACEDRSIRVAFESVLGCDGHMSLRM